MNNQEGWPPADQVEKDVVKLLTPETIKDIRERVIGAEQLKAILLTYSPGLFNDRSEMTEETIDIAVERFLRRYTNLQAFKGAKPHGLGELLAEFPDIKEDMKTFKTIMYGKDGNIRYQPKPTADQEEDTQELPPLEDVLSGKFKHPLNQNLPEMPSPPPPVDFSGQPKPVEKLTNKKE